MKQIVFHKIKFKHVKKIKSLFSTHDLRNYFKIYNLDVK